MFWRRLRGAWLIVVFGLVAALGAGVALPRVRRWRSEVVVPRVDFFLFGMGRRQKLLYKDGTLSDALTGERVRSWTPKSERIEPAEYSVTLDTDQGPVAIREDEAAVWITERGQRTAVTSHPLHLPRFEGHPRAAELRVLHHEILINLVDGAPLPNFFVYKKPFYRDAAMMAMVLAKTGNVDEMRDWILGLREPYDRCNGGQEDTDNLGQTLYLISLVGDASHPLVPKVLAEAERHRVGQRLEGNTDFAPHPVYQTKWMKFGLKRLGLPDAWIIPAVADAYSGLFWWDYTESHVGEPAYAHTVAYPYLTWAEAHFFRLPPPPLRRVEDYPLSWEAHASQARYLGLWKISSDLVIARCAMPHTWHASEMFLYLVEGAP